MFVEGIVAVCNCGKEVHVDDVAFVAPTADAQVLYITSHGHQVTVSIETHRHAAKWLRARANNDLVEPSDDELTLVDFESLLNGVRTVTDLESVWAK